MRLGRSIIGWISVDLINDFTGGHPFIGHRISAGHPYQWIPRETSTTPFSTPFLATKMMEVADKSYQCYIQYYSKWVRARKQDDFFIHDIHFFPFSRPSLILLSLELNHAARWPFRDHGLACWPTCTVIGGTVNRKMGWMGRRKLFLSKMWPLKGVMVICHDERGFTPC